MVDCIHALNRSIPQKQTQLPETKIFPENRQNHQNPKRKGNPIPTLPCFRAEVMFVSGSRVSMPQPAPSGTFGATRQRPSWTSPSRNVWAPSGARGAGWLVGGWWDGGMVGWWSVRAGGGGAMVFPMKPSTGRIFQYQYKNSKNFIVIISPIQSYRFKFKYFQCDLSSRGNWDFWNSRCWHVMELWLALLLNHLYNSWVASGSPRLFIKNVLLWIKHCNLQCYLKTMYSIDKL